LRDGADDAWRLNVRRRTMWRNETSWCGDLCFLARRDREMSDRLRGRCYEPARRTGASVGRSNRIVAADGLLRKYGPRSADPSTVRMPAAMDAEAVPSRAIGWFRSLHRSLVDSMAAAPSDSRRLGCRARPVRPAWAPARVAAMHGRARPCGWFVPEEVAGDTGVA
jgi:hypothetical protein